MASTFKDTAKAVQPASRNAAPRGNHTQVHAVTPQASRRRRPEKVPVGCQACGGPYPLCKDGCPAFDDD